MALGQARLDGAPTLACFGTYPLRGSVALTPCTGCCLESLRRCLGRMCLLVNSPPKVARGLLAGGVPSATTKLKPAQVVLTVPGRLAGRAAVEVPAAQLPHAA